MLLPSIVVKESQIQGLGLFATQDIPRGCIVWHPCRQCKVWSLEDVGRLSEAQLQYLDEYGYRLASGGIFLPCSNTHLMNHACDAAVLDFGLDFGVAVRAIRAGDEIKCDYRTFVNDPRWEFRCACRSFSCVEDISPWQGLDAALQQCWQVQLSEAVRLIPTISQPLEDTLMDCSPMYRNLRSGSSKYGQSQKTSIRSPAFLF